MSLQLRHAGHEYAPPAPFQSNFSGRCILVNSEASYMTSIGVQNSYYVTFRAVLVQLDMAGFA